MQHASVPSLPAVSAIVALAFAGCASSAAVMSYSETSPLEPAGDFKFFTTDAVLHAAAQAADRRIRAAVGDTGLHLLDPERARACTPLTADCGFELQFREVVYCLGDPAPAKACTSQGERGRALGIAMQAQLQGAELENRLIHELFHVITRNQAPHSSDGLFMEYSIGTERISTGTLESVCSHFNCSRFESEYPADL